MKRPAAILTQPKQGWGLHHHVEAAVDWLQVLAFREVFCCRCLCDHNIFFVLCCLVADVTLPTASVPPKKKSRVVTTSGAHPDKGYRPYIPKKASNTLLDKTIESCKAYLKDNADIVSIIV